MILFCCAFVMIISSSSVSESLCSLCLVFLLCERDRIIDKTPLKNALFSMRIDTQFFLIISEFPIKYRRIPMYR
jgi:hypothetical protein